MILTENFETRDARNTRMTELREQGFKDIVKYSDPVKFEEFGTTWWETRWFVGYEAKDLIYA